MAKILRYKVRSKIRCWEKGRGGGGGVNLGLGQPLSSKMSKDTSIAKTGVVFDRQPVRFMWSPMFFNLSISSLALVSVLRHSETLGLRWLFFPLTVSVILWY